MDLIPKSFETISIETISNGFYGTIESIVTIFPSRGKEDFRLSKVHKKGR